MTNETLEQKAEKKALVICAEIGYSNYLESMGGERFDFAAKRTKRIVPIGTKFERDYVDCFRHLRVLHQNEDYHFPKHLSPISIEIDSKGREVQYTCEIDLPMIAEKLKSRKYAAILMAGDLRLGLGINPREDDPTFYSEDYTGYYRMSDGDCLARDIGLGHYGDLNKKTPIYGITHKKDSIHRNLLAGRLRGEVEGFITNILSQ